MAVLNDPNTAANIMRVGMGGTPGWMPAHTTSGPLSVGNGGAFRAALNSGTMAASLANNSEMFQFRYVTSASRVCLVHGVTFSAGIITLPALSATVATSYTFALSIARGWTGIGSGGTRFTLTGDNQALRTSHATSEVNDIGISTTAGLTAGTKTIDSQGIAFVTGSFTAATAVGVGISTMFPRTSLFGDYFAGMSWPVVLANQEGLVIRNSGALPGTMTWTFTVDIAWSEVDGF